MTPNTPKNLLSLKTIIKMPPNLETNKRKVYQLNHWKTNKESKTTVTWKQKPLYCGLSQQLLDNIILYSDLYNVKPKTKAWGMCPYFMYNNHQETKEKRNHCPLINKGRHSWSLWLHITGSSNHMHNWFLQFQTSNKPSITCFLELKLSSTTPIKYYKIP